MQPFKFEVDDVPEQDWKIVQAIRDFLGEIKQSTTNADLIRVMSDEELADFISSCGCPNHARDCQQSCKECVLKWLREPAEDRQ